MIHLTDEDAEMASDLIDILGGIGVWPKIMHEMAERDYNVDTLERDMERVILKLRGG